jgi:hypothetical protein
MSDERLHRLLPRYLIGRLDEDEVARFLKHLQSCEECQAEKAFLEDVRAQFERKGNGFLEDHPRVDQLVAYLRRDLPEAEAAGIRDHLNLCATCATEVRWISGEAVAATAASEPASPRGGRSWIWVAAAAAAIVLAALLPSPFSQRWRPETGSLDPQLVAQIERAEERQNIIYLPSGEAGLVVFFPVDLPTSDFPCKAEIVRDDGVIVHVRTAMSRDDLFEDLYVFVQCARVDCRPGTYTVRIENSGGELLETIPFRVVESGRGSE